MQGNAVRSVLRCARRLNEGSCTGRRFESLRFAKVEIEVEEKSEMYLFIIFKRDARHVETTTC